MAKEKEERKVYLLRETYKDNDPETVGAYDSMRALCKGFAARVVSGNIPSSFNPSEAEDIATSLAQKVAHLLPALLGEDWAGDECRDGRTVYGIDELEVECDSDSEKEEDDG